MRDPTLVSVRERLLRAGIAPRHVRRYIAELQDHLEDLVARERSAGLDGQAAAARARQMLGTDLQLAQAMIDRGTPRSLAASTPWMVFGVLPLLALVTMMIVLGIASFAFFAPFQNLPGDSIPQHVRAIGGLVTLVGSYCVGPALAIACIAVALRQRLSSRWVWAGLALLALASGVLGVHVDFLQPQGDSPGGIRGAMAQTVHAAGRIDVAATLLVVSIRASVLFMLSVLALRLLRKVDVNAAR